MFWRYQQCMTLGFPLPGARVYMWKKIGDVLPDSPLEFHNWDYRDPVPGQSFAAIFGIYRQQFEVAYHAHYDMWDIWFKEDISQEVNMEFSATSTSHYSLPLPSTTMTGDTPSDNDEAVFQGLDTMSHSTLLVEYDMEFSPDFIEQWYGLLPEFCNNPLPEYSRFPTKQIHTVFGQHRDLIPSLDGVKMSMSGWAWSLYKHKWDSGIMKRCWDLHPEHPEFILKQPIKGMLIRSAGVPHGTYYQKMYTVQYSTDPPSTRWMLLVNAVTLVYLLRTRTATDSNAAVQQLIMAGCAFHTIQHASSGRKHLQKEYNPMPIYRPSTHRPTNAEYTTQWMGILDLLQLPHARAALMKGGIIWRIVMEMLGQNKNLWNSMVEQVCNGPSASPPQQYTMSLTGINGTYVDDDLSVQELDLISGVVKVYTGNTAPSCAHTLHSHSSP